MLNTNWNCRRDGVYSKTARFDKLGMGLSEDELHTKAPSVFAVQAHESRSERFTPIPTIEMVRGLSNEGFVPVAVKQCKTSDIGKREYTKHLVRFRKVDPNITYHFGGTVCEIILKNANDGSCCYELLAGLFRIACLNSLVTLEQGIDAIKIRHSGNPLPDVIEGSYRVLHSASRALEVAEQWKQIALPQPVKERFLEAAHVLRFADAEGTVETPIKPEQLNVPRRQADIGNDLWRTFNRVQENAMKGGLWARQPRQPNGNRGRAVTTRTVNGIDQDLRLNKALWILAGKTAEYAKAESLLG